MAEETAAELRHRAAQARRIASDIHSDTASVELRQIADALEAEAERLELGNAASRSPRIESGAT